MKIYPHLVPSNNKRINDENLEKEIRSLRSEIRMVFLPKTAMVEEIRN